MFDINIAAVGVAVATAAFAVFEAAAVGVAATAAVVLLFELLVVFDKSVAAAVVKAAFVPLDELVKFAVAVVGVAAAVLFHIYYWNFRPHLEVVYQRELLHLHLFQQKQFASGCLETEVVVFVVASAEEGIEVCVSWMSELAQGMKQELCCFDES